jgi:cytochrome d ubiquinol oxidase subunit I
MVPSELVAATAGWIVTEAGRQPYTADGVLRAAGITPAPAVEPGRALPRSGGE